MSFYDAHNHLHDTRLAPFLDSILQRLDQLPLRGAVVNGTCQADWPQVAALAARHPWIVPSFGLHPWHVHTRSGDWLSQLVGHLDSHPRAAVGEIGLDRWIQPHHLPTQAEVFLAQLLIAAERDLPVSIHCLKAWGALQDILRTSPLPKRGFLLHAYGGPIEMLAPLVDLGAYFSFSPYFLHARKSAQRVVFAAIPAERLLIETDAPDMAPPEALNRFPLTALDDPGTPLNDPSNLLAAYEGLADIRTLSLPNLQDLVQSNYRHFFLDRN